MKTVAIAGTGRGQAIEDGSLRETATRSGLLFGSAVSYRELQDSTFTSLLARQASIVVPENEMKWERIHPEPNRYDFKAGDTLAAFAEAHEQKLRGHNLCWHRQLPPWFKQLANAGNAQELLRTHISEVAGHYAGKIHSWDVVNEAINIEDGRPDGLRKSIWLELVGPDYLAVAFKAASAADGKAVLTYNDYDLEQDSPKHEAKRAAVLKLLATLQSNDAPIQALGIQSHLKASQGRSEWTGLHRFLNKVEAMKLQVFVTELDVNDADLPGNIEERDRDVAALYGDFLHQVLQHRCVKAVLTWGLTDRDSWLNSFKPRADGLPKRPLPFDSNMQAKPAFYAIQEALSQRPRTL